MSELYKVATWNVNSLRVRLAQLLEWLEVNRPDIIALQEIKVEDINFPLAAIQEMGYHALYAGQKSYNGVAILSRKPPTSEFITELSDFPDPQRRVLIASYDDLRVVNLYVPNGSSVGSEKYGYKLNWLNKLIALIEQEVKVNAKIIILGDFNIAPEDKDVYDPVAWAGQVLVSPAEREALQRLINLGFYDTFRLFEQDGNHFSWWDYRAGAFRRNHGLRIDHILSSHALKEHIIECKIDKAWRSLEQPSDHAPVMAVYKII